MLQFSNLTVQNVKLKLEIDSLLLARVDIIGEDVSSEVGLSDALEESGLLGLPLGLHRGVVHRVLREDNPVDLVLDGHTVDLGVGLLDLLDSLDISINPLLLLLVLLDVPLDPPEGIQHHKEHQPKDDNAVNDLFLVLAEERGAVVHISGLRVPWREEDRVDPVTRDLKVELLSRLIKGPVAGVSVLDPLAEAQIGSPETVIVLLVGTSGLVDRERENHREFVWDVGRLGTVVIGVGLSG